MSTSKEELEPTDYGCSSDSLGRRIGKSFESHITKVLILVVALSWNQALKESMVRLGLEKYSVLVAIVLTLVSCLLVVVAEGVYYAVGDAPNENKPHKEHKKE